jgi:hypothetical protein
MIALSLLPPNRKYSYSGKFSAASGFGHTGQLGGSQQTKYAGHEDFSAGSELFQQENSVLQHLP